MQKPLYPRLDPNEGAKAHHIHDFARNVRANRILVFSGRPRVWARNGGPQLSSPLLFVDFGDPNLNALANLVNLCRICPPSPVPKGLPAVDCALEAIQLDFDE